MIKIIVHGCNGKMGSVLVRLINNDDETVVVAGFDRTPDKCDHPFPVYSHLSDCSEKCDVIIDFSHHSLVPDLLDYCITTNTPVILATSGISADQKKNVQEASKKISVFQAPNMSMGVNVVMNLAIKAAEILGNSFDIELIEKYHNKKNDSPSGTTLMIANGLKDVFEDKKEFIFGRHGNMDQRTSADIGIHSIRGGTFIGEHTIIFAGEDEIVEITHKALSKDIFGLGAIKAAKFLINKENGFYTMNDLVK